jgi:hypothetical protein
MAPATQTPGRAGAPGGQEPGRMPGKYKDLITEHRREETD